MFDQHFSSDGVIISLGKFLLHIKHKLTHYWSVILLFVVCFVVKPDKFIRFKKKTLLYGTTTSLSRDVSNLPDGVNCIQEYIWLYFHKLGQFKKRKFLNPCTFKGLCTSYVNQIHLHLNLQSNTLKLWTNILNKWLNYTWINYILYIGKIYLNLDTKYT